MMPRKTKYRRHMRGNVKGKSTRGYGLSFGDYGLKVLGRGFISARQLEAARRSITNATKRSGKLWIRVFPDKPITKKPNEVRMGGGKGAVDHYSAVVRPGKIIFELSGVSKDLAEEAFRKASDKLPFRTKFIENI